MPADTSCCTDPSSRTTCSAVCTKFDAGCGSSDSNPLASKVKAWKAIAPRPVDTRFNHGLEHDSALFAQSQVFYGTNHFFSIRQRLLAVLLDTLSFSHPHLSPTHQLARSTRRPSNHDRPRMPSPSPFCARVCFHFSPQMVLLRLQKRLAAAVMKCGQRKVWLDPNESNEISNANSRTYFFFLGLVSRLGE